MAGEVVDLEVVGVGFWGFLRGRRGLCGGFEGKAPLAFGGGAVVVCWLQRGGAHVVHG